MPCGATPKWGRGWPLLYAINTAGAVFGTVAAAFVLLPALGLNRTVWVGVAVNALVFVIAAALARGQRDRVAGEADGAGRARAAAGPPGFADACIRPLFRRAEPGRERLAAVFRAQPGWMLPLMLVSGANAFLYEVLWTRMLAHVIGGSIYAFATMLAAFFDRHRAGRRPGGQGGRSGASGPRWRSRSPRRPSACSPSGSTPGWGC